MHDSVSKVNKQSIYLFILMEYSLSRVVKSVKFVIPSFETFSQQDLARLKHDYEWLSDSHITLSLLFVYLFYLLSLSE